MSTSVRTHTFVLWLRSSNWLLLYIDLNSSIERISVLQRARMELIFLAHFSSTNRISMPETNYSVPQYSTRDFNKWVYVCCQDQRQFNRFTIYDDFFPFNFLNNCFICWTSASHNSFECGSVLLAANRSSGCQVLESMIRACAWHCAMCIHCTSYRPVFHATPYVLWL